MRSISDNSEAVSQLQEEDPAEPESHSDWLARRRESFRQKQVAGHQKTAPGAIGLSRQIYNVGGAQLPAQLPSPKKLINGEDPWVISEPFSLGDSTRQLNSQNSSTVARQPSKARRVCGLSTTILLVIAAFLIGGGIAGGVGGSFAVKNRTSNSNSSNVSNTSSTSSATASASTSKSTTVVDAAGCPLSNGTIYTSATKSSFLIKCDYDILPVGGTYIDVSNKLETSLDSCLDYCASYNQDEANAALGGCVAATWVIFSSTTPATNERCYIKNETGVASLGSANGQVLVSGYLQS